MIESGRRITATLLRSSLVNHAVRTLASLRGHGLVLVYHRLGVAAPSGCEIVPSVPVDVFRAQLQALGEVVDLVTLDELLARHGPGRAVARWRRPAVAITFDDDLPSHGASVLPVLRECRVPAAFFLSGRVLHGLGPYWFQCLEALLVAHGQRGTAALLGVPEAPVRDLVRACEGNAELRRRVSERAAGVSASEVLKPDEIASLAAAGMTIGFHTIEHDVLPSLDGPALDDAVSRGRTDLAAAAGTTVRYFAYPHGKADARSAYAVRRAGFEAAFTGRPQPVGTGADLFSLGRWEPGPLGADDLLVNMAIRLHRLGRHSPERSS